MEVIEKWHPDTDGTGKCLVEKMRRAQPEWFGTTSEIQGDFRNVLSSFKKALAANKMIGDEQARVALLSLALSSFPNITHAELIKQLGVTEHDIRKSSRFSIVYNMLPTWWYITFNMLFFLLVNYCLLS
jgi:hypothetical protein